MRNQRWVFRWIWRSERGSGLVETALVLPLTIGLLFAAMDFGRVFYSGMAVTQAARAGVQYGAQSVNISVDTPGMKNVAMAAASDIPGFNATAVRSCACWNPSAGTETTNPSCGTCASSLSLRVYVTVTGTRTFQTIGSYPGIPDTVVITRSATRRAQ